MRGYREGVEGQQFGIKSPVKPISEGAPAAHH
jgi:hypothetical protein